MKKKSTSQSAFFNPRFLIGAFVALAGISLALFATANPVRPTAAQAQQKYKVTTQSSIDPLVPAGFDCSKIHRLGIDRQENLRAGAVMIFCGLSEGGKASTSGGKKHFLDRKSTRLNSSHSQISYAVFCLKKKKKQQYTLYGDSEESSVI